jgi:hypothetical protein
MLGWERILKEVIWVNPRTVPEIASGTEENHFCNPILFARPPLWSSGQRSWLQILEVRIFREVVGLERGPLSLVSTVEELLGRNSSGSGLERRKYGRRDPWWWTCNTLYPHKLALISPTSGGRSVGIVCSRTQATELVCLWLFLFYLQSVYSVNCIDILTMACRRVPFCN